MPSALQQVNARVFHDLHYSGDMLILPNIWDPLGATLLESLHYPAVATASASVAFTHGYDDGEHIPFAELLELLRRIVSRVAIPVTADIESGFAEDDAKLEENIRQLIDTGISGINLEDTRDYETLSIERQCKRISLVRKVAREMEVPLFINARTDIYLRGAAMDEKEKLERTLQRGRAYLDAGGNGFYPIGMKEEASIERVVNELECPINIILMPGSPKLQTLRTLGVARVSVGPSLLRVAIKAMRDVVQQLQNGTGEEVITGTGITSDYLRELAQGRVKASDRI